MNENQKELIRRLTDCRSRKVVFLSHCILNENTRYLGGAGRGGCVEEIVKQCIKHDLGIVQMPCPEQHAWGGILKRYFLLAYGMKWTHPLVYRFRRILLIIGLYYTRLIYRRLARQTARQIEDYIASGFSVVGIVGIDGSPSCAVNRTISFKISDRLFSIPIDSLTKDEQNRLLKEHLVNGRGIFIDELLKELERRGIEISFLAHDLFAELFGKKSGVKFE